MKNNKKTINVLVDQTAEQNAQVPSDRIYLYPETFLMPKDAAIKTKEIIDKFLESDKDEFNISTVSTDVCIMTKDYGSFKGCTIKLFYQGKPSTMPRVFKKFNESFSYIEKVTGEGNNDETGK